MHDQAAGPNRATSPAGANRGFASPAAASKLPSPQFNSSSRLFHGIRESSPGFCYRCHVYLLERGDLLRLPIAATAA